MTELKRSLGTADAALIGIGSMIGAGIFAAIGPAARAAGSGLLIGLAIAAVIAYCNAVASAQLAAQYPVSGGTYVYGRERLGEWWGFGAGWCFVIGKTASCAAMAATFGAYVVDSSDLGRRAAGVAAVVVLTVVSTRGVTRTARLTRAIVTVSLAVLALTVVLLLGARGPDPGRLAPDETSFYGIMQSAGLLFFAFAGYARIATMGEEVRDPARTIPRAIVLALAVAVSVYVVVAAATLAVAGPAPLASSDAALATALDVVGVASAQPVLAVGAAIACLGALLALLNGISRTSLAMARERDLPAWLARVHPENAVPARAQWCVGAVVVVLVASVDLREIIGFSSFGVLLYYAVANASAWTQDRAHRRWPRPFQAAGVIGCVMLAATLPVPSVLSGLGVLAAGLLGRLILHRLPRRPANEP